MRTIVYWITTALTAFVFLSGGVVDIMRPSFALDGMLHLGYPAYFLLILGVWKVLGGLVVLTPGTPKLKEWAYAGMFFDLTGASFSHFSVHDPLPKIVTPLIIVCIVMLSWALRSRNRKVH
jgi:uncharacterized membrane protein YphA (DoxX/SURF4 family)